MDYIESDLERGSNEGCGKVNVTDPCNDKAPWKAALEDAGVIGGITLVSSLITAGFPPSVQLLYTAGLSAIFIGITTWATKRGIGIGSVKKGE